MVRLGRKTGGCGDIRAVGDDREVGAATDVGGDAARGRRTSLPTAVVLAAAARVGEMGGREDDWASGGTGCINKAVILAKFSEEGNILVKFFEEGNILARPDRLLFAVDAGSHIVYLKLLSGCNQYSRMV